MEMRATKFAVLAEDNKSNQMYEAIRISNRLAVAEIRLKRANLLSDGVISEIKGINESRHLLTDSILLGEDVLEELKLIEQRVAHIEQTIDV